MTDQSRALLHEASANATAAGNAERWEDVRQGMIDCVGALELIDPRDEEAQRYVRAAMNELQAALDRLHGE